MSRNARSAASIWRFGALRRLYAAALLTSVATWATQVGLSVAVLEHHSGGGLAAMLLAGNLPALLVGPLAGAVADQYRPGPVARVALVAQALGLLGIAAGGTGRSLAPAACGYAAFLVAGRFCAPALQRLRYGVLPDSLWPAGNAAIGSVGGVATILGAVAGTATVTTLGTGTTFMLAAAVVLLATVVVWPVPARDSGDAARAPRRLELGGGVAALRRYPVARAVVLVGLAWGLVGGGYDVLLGVFGTRLLRTAGLGIGLLYLADGVGVLVGSLVGGRIPARWRAAAFTAGYLAQGTWWAVLSVTRAPVPAVLVLLLMRTASGVVIALDTTLLLQTVPERLHGRVFSIHSVSYGAMLRVSLTLTGALLATAGVRTLILAGGLGSVLVGLLFWALAMHRSTRGRDRGRRRGPGRRRRRRRGHRHGSDADADSSRSARNDHPSVSQ